MKNKTDYKAYLVAMAPDIKVHFVCFETTLESEPFMQRWKEYKRSPYSDKDVLLQRSRKNELFYYIAQHRFKTDDAPFEFAKERRSSRITQERIKTTNVGGYIPLPSRSIHEAAQGESKIFIFLTDPNPDLALYNKIPPGVKLNIYQAYYQNCRFSYILEYFVKNKYAGELGEQLKKIDVSDMAVFTQFAHVKNTSGLKKKGNYEWPA